MKLLFGDKKFLNTMLKLASPIMLQNLIFASLNMVDGIMIGQLGESAVATAGIANQIFFLVSLLFFSIGSGSAIFAAQYWGQKDIERIQSVLGLPIHWVYLLDLADEVVKLAMGLYRFFSQRWINYLVAPV